MRKLLLPLLLLLVFGCTSSDHTPATPISITELQNVLKDMKLIQNRPALDAEIARRRNEFLKQQADRLAASNLATRAGFYRVVASGGFPAILQQQLAELKSAPPALTVGGGAQRLVAIAAIENVIKNIAFCTKPLAFLAAETVTPGQMVEIDGCHFGTTIGSVLLTGPFPNGSLTLPVSSWTDTAILVTVPAVTAVPDGAATIIVSPPAMPSAAPIDTQFIATRATAILYPAQYADCQRKTQDDFCGYISGDPLRETTFMGYHWSRGIFFGVGGGDRYYAVLKNGWVIMPCTSPNFQGAGWPGPPTGVPVNWSGHASCSQYWSNDPRHISSVTGFTPGSSIVDGTANWWVDANCSGIEYEGDILVTGPVGLPYY
jgi:hypothetical protein